MKVYHQMRNHLQGLLVGKDMAATNEARAENKLIMVGYLEL